MRKRPILLLFLCIIPFVFFKLYLSLPVVFNKLGGKRGHSDNILESKERGVFVKEVDFCFYPDSIKIEEFQAFIEKGYRYGERDPSQTDVLLSGDFLYQLVFSKQRGKNQNVVEFVSDIDKIRSCKYLKSETFSDTLCLKVIKYKNYEYMGVIGAVKVWCNSSPR